MILSRSTLFSLLAVVGVRPTTAHTASEQFARINTARVAEQRAHFQAIIDQRHNKRVAAGAICVSTVAGLVGALAYSWSKPASAQKTTKLSKKDVDQLSAEMVDQLIKERRELRTASGIMKYKFTEGVALGLAGALVTFVLTQSSRASSSVFPLIETLLPMSDMPLLLQALRRTFTTGRHYTTAMLNMLKNPTIDGSFAYTIMQRTKQSEHLHLVTSLEASLAWIACFANEFGTATNTQLQAVGETLAHTVEQLARQCEEKHGMTAETLHLVGSINLQIEQLATIVIATVQELGYEV